jgi:Cu-Zn family superoxide dismutase
MRPHWTMATLSLLTFACAARDGDGNDTAVADSPATASTPAVSADPSVTTTVRDASGRDLGTLTLTETGAGIAVAGRLTGLTPGDHGMHFHTVGRCDAPGFESAGEHWNPTNAQHGAQHPQGPHFGDMPNVSVGPDSIADVQATTAGGSLRGAQQALLDADGAALIIHASRDDQQTNPSGRSGNPVACGVISGS